MIIEVGRCDDLSGVREVATADDMLTIVDMLVAWQRQATNLEGAVVVGRGPVVRCLSKSSRADAPPSRQIIVDIFTHFPNREIIG